MTSESSPLERPRVESVIVSTLTIFSEVSLTCAERLVEAVFQEPVQRAAKVAIAR